MKKLLSDGRFAFVSREDRDFILAFDASMHKAGYANNGIQEYVVFGKYKIEYFKPGNKSKKYIARIYFRDDGIVLRMYFSNIDRHKASIESAPDYIKKPFVDGSHKCKRPNCKAMGADIEKCRYRKTYSIDGVRYEACAELSFCYYNPQAKDTQGYIDLLAAFYSIKKAS